MDLIISSLVLGAFIYFIMLYHNEPKPEVSTYLLDVQNTPFQSNMYRDANEHLVADPNKVNFQLLQNNIIAAEIVKEDTPRLTDPFWNAPKSVFTVREPYRGWINTSE